MLEINYGEVTSADTAVVKLETNAKVDDGRNHQIEVKLASNFMSARVDDGLVFTRAIPKVFIIYLSTFFNRRII